MNYTPLDVVAFQKRALRAPQKHESFDINAIFLSLIVITLAIMAGLLFILIQKKLQELAYISFFA